MTLLEVDIFMVFVKKGVGKFTHAMSVTLIIFCGADVKRKLSDPRGEEGDKSELKQQRFWATHVNRK